MTTDPNAVASLTSQLCATLDRLEAALIRVDTDALLTTEATLGSLVDALAAAPAVRGASAADRAALAVDIRRGQAALLRCKRLGASFSAIARARLARLIPGGSGGAYDRDGAPQAQTLVGSAVKVAV